MATILNAEQRSRRQVTALGSPNTTPHPKPISSEAELCAVFMRDFNAQPGWTCYPETGGFDVLVVHEDGRQIGVEAKLTLNAKVIEQILPRLSGEYNGAVGPDHRMIIVSKLSDSSKGLAVILRRLGVEVLDPGLSWTQNGHEYSFNIENLVRNEKVGGYVFGNTHLYDWWPVERCHVPPVVPTVSAGVRSPIQLTPWKEKALRMIALMRQQGFITVKQMAELGLHSTGWTQPTGSKPAWLAKGKTRGSWVETEHMPPFDKQHAEMYALAVSELANAPQTPLALF